MIYLRTHHVKIYTVLIILLIFSSGCNKRYWYRDKIRIYGLHRKTRTIHIKVINNSPEYLSELFENNIRHYVQYKLAKKGYSETKKDTADFDLTIELRVDSFHTTGYTRFAGFWDHPNVRQLSIRYFMLCGRYQHECWDFLNEFYFFYDEPVDLRRSKGLVRYSLKQIPPNN